VVCETGTEREKEITRKRERERDVSESSIRQHETNKKQTITTNYHKTTHHPIDKTNKNKLKHCELQKQQKRTKQKKKNTTNQKPKPKPIQEENTLPSYLLFVTFRLKSIIFHCRSFMQKETKTY